MKQLNVKDLITVGIFYSHLFGRLFVTFMLGYIPF